MVKHYIKGKESNGEGECERRHEGKDKNREERKCGRTLKENGQTDIQTETGKQGQAHTHRQTM